MWSSKALALALALTLALNPDPLSGIGDIGSDRVFGARFGGC